MEATFLIFFKGILSGFLIACPIGPVSLLCLKRTLERHLKLAFSSALGATAADSFLALVSSLGIKTVTNFLEDSTVSPRLIGAGMTFILGLVFLFQSPSPKKRHSSILGVFPSFFSAFLITLFNPLTLIAFAATFSAFGIETLSKNSYQLWFLILGVFSGASLWWLLLISATLLARNRFGLQDVWRIHKGAGILLIGFSLFMLASL